MDFMGLLSDQSSNSFEPEKVKIDEVKPEAVVNNDIYYLGILNDLKDIRVEINKLKKLEEKLTVELNQYVLEEHKKNGSPKELFSSKYSIVYREKNSTEFDLEKLKRKVDITTLLSVAKFTEAGLKSIIHLETELNECKIITTEKKYQFKDVKGV